MVPVQIAVIFTFTPTCRCTQPTPKQLPSLRLMSSVAQIHLWSCSFKKVTLGKKNQINLTKSTPYRPSPAFLSFKLRGIPLIGLPQRKEEKARQEILWEKRHFLSSFVRPWLSAADVGEVAHYWRVMPTDWSPWITNMYQEQPILGSAYCWMGPFDCVLKKKRLNCDRCVWPY